MLSQIDGCFFSSKCATFVEMCPFNPHPLQWILKLLAKRVQKSKTNMGGRRIFQRFDFSGQKNLTAKCPPRIFLSNNLEYILASIDIWSNHQDREHPWLTLVCSDRWNHKCQVKLHMASSLLLCLGNAFFFSVTIGWNWLLPWPWLLPCTSSWLLVWLWLSAWLLLQPCKRPSKASLPPQ